MLVRRAFAVALVGCLAALATGCGPEPEIVGRPPAGPTRLYIDVSNQSFDIASVDMEVTIDGVRSIAGAFDVEDQHQEYGFAFDVQEGEHRIKVTSDDAPGLTLDEPFTIHGTTWAILDFLFYAEAEDGHGKTPKQFLWLVGNDPPGFD